MPLMKGTADHIVKKNIHEMMKAGHPREQAVAAALRMKRESEDEMEKRHKGEGGGH